MKQELWRKGVDSVMRDTCRLGDDSYVGIRLDDV